MSRVQESPFRETEWDQRLDRMLDDLKSTVTSDSEAEQWEPRRIRSSSRSDSRGSGRGSIEDAGRLKHHHREYTSPDSRSRLVADQYEYDSGTADKPRNFQKKVMKSTYTNYSVSGGLSNDMDSLKQGMDQRSYERAVAGSRDDPKGSSELDPLPLPPPPLAEQSAFPETQIIERVSPIELTLPQSDTMKTSSTDCSTLTRLRNNINELDHLIVNMDSKQGHAQTVLTQSNVQQRSSHCVERESNLTEQSQSTHQLNQSQFFQQSQNSEFAQQSQYSSSQIVERNSDASSTQRIEDHERESSVELLSQNVDDGVSVKSVEIEPTLPPLPESIAMEAQESDAENTKLFYNASSTATHNTYSNGLSSKINPNTVNEDDLKLDMEDGGKSGEVRRIVWRNRFEKTYETQDSSKTPTMTIEEDAHQRHQSLKDEHNLSTSTTLSHHHLNAANTSPPQRGPVSPRHLQLQYAVYLPVSPNISPGSQSWADPIPIPTPPQVSPRGEPGVAYMYTYGQGGGSQVQHLPPLNYVSLPGASSVPASEGAPSPTPSSAANQPVVYHYSYHYTLQPGQQLPNGVPPHPNHAPITTTQTTQPPPALQIANQVHTGRPETQEKSSVNNYNIYSSNNRSTTTSTSVNRTENKSTVNRYHQYPSGSSGSKPSPGPCGPGCPVDRDGPGLPISFCGPDCPGKPRRYRLPNESNDNDPNRPGGPNTNNDPNRPGGPNSNVSITINKTTTHHSSKYPGGTGPDGTPLTSTPYSNRNRSRSPSPDRKNRGPLMSPDDPGTLYITRSSYSDSLDRVRRRNHQGLPFPETSPIKPGEARIPRRVDDLMEDFSDTEGRPGTGNGYPRGGAPDYPEREPLIDTDTRAKVDTEILSNQTRVEEKREPTKSIAGSPVYYPPGHQLFHETMHTMTLKENKRRGKAKWRMEKEAAYKESSSSSETKGGMAMVPVCLPLCCGAACVVM